MENRNLLYKLYLTDMQVRPASAFTNSLIFVVFTLKPKDFTNSMVLGKDSFIQINSFIFIIFAPKGSSSGIVIILYSSKALTSTQFGFISMVFSSKAVHPVFRCKQPSTFTVFTS